MENKNVQKISFILFLAFLFLKPALAYESTFDPRKSARYDSSADNVIYFLSISDTHIGYEGLLFNNPYEKELEWFLDSCLTIINPSATVNTGDLTDASLWLIPRAVQLGPQQRDEWKIYDSLTENLDTYRYFDIPGNHDRYGDPSWEGSFNSTDSAWFGYTRSSVLGKNYWNDTTIPVGQFAKTITSPNGDSHILIGANTCDEEGKIWYPWWLVSDDPTLSVVERDYIERELKKFALMENPKLSFIFGHASIYRLTTFWQSPSEWVLNELGEKPVDRGGHGGPEFVGLLNQYKVSTYLFGHTHKNRDFYDKNSKHGISARLMNITSLTENGIITPYGSYRIVVVDNNGVVTRTFLVKHWPIVLITSPLDTKTTGLDIAYNTSSVLDLYSYVLYPRPDNFVRAVSFDPLGIEKVEFKYKKISSSDWSSPVQMAKVFETSYIWQGSWDCSSLEDGEYELAVRSVSKENKEDSHIITVKINNQDCIFVYPNSGGFFKGQIPLKAQIKEEVLPRVDLVEFLFSIDDKKTWQSVGTISGPFQDKNIEMPFDSQSFGIKTERVWFKVAVLVRKL